MLKFFLIKTNEFQIDRTVFNFHTTQENGIEKHIKKEKNKRKLQHKN